MMSLFLYNIDDLLERLADPTLDYRQFDNQLFNELHCCRLTVADSMRVYKVLVEKHNYVMTAKDLEKLIFYTDLYAIDIKTANYGRKKGV
jgi:hypothetical protein